eukprot:6933616-Pyramimonas_sp.AAC.1
MLHYAPDSTAFGSDTAASCCQHPPYPCWQLPTTEPQWKNCPTGPPQSVTPLIPRSEPKPYIDATTTITQYVRGGGDRFGAHPAARAEVDEPKTPLAGSSSPE